MTSIFQIVRNNTPITINVETFPDFSRDANKEMIGIMDPLQKMGRSLFLLTKTVKYHNESVSVWGGPLYFNALMIAMGDHFPIELGFCITILKAQRRTISN